MSEKKTIYNRAIPFNKIEDVLPFLPEELVNRLREDDSIEGVSFVEIPASLQDLFKNVIKEEREPYAENEKEIYFGNRECGTPIFTVHGTPEDIFKHISRFVGGEEEAKETKNAKEVKPFNIAEFLDEIGIMKMIEERLNKDNGVRYTSDDAIRRRKEQKAGHSCSEKQCQEHTKEEKVKTCMKETTKSEAKGVDILETFINGKKLGMKMPKAENVSIEIFNSLIKEKGLNVEDLAKLFEVDVEYMQKILYNLGILKREEPKKLPIQVFAFELSSYPYGRIIEYSGGNSSVKYADLKGNSLEEIKFLDFLAKSMLTNTLSGNCSEEYFKGFIKEFQTMLRMKKISCIKDGIVIPALNKSSQSVEYHVYDLKLDDVLNKDINELTKTYLIC